MDPKAKDNRLSFFLELKLVLSSIYWPCISYYLDDYYI